MFIELGFTWSDMYPTYDKPGKTLAVEADLAHKAGLKEPVCVDQVTVEL